MDTIRCRYIFCQFFAHLRQFFLSHQLHAPLVLSGRLNMLLCIQFAYRLHSVYPTTGDMNPATASSQPELCAGTVAHFVAGKLVVNTAGAGFGVQPEGGTGWQGETNAAAAGPHLGVAVWVERAIKCDGTATRLE